MCELFAVSSKLPTKITFSLEEFASHGGKKAHHTDGWGLAFYDGPFAQIFHEAKPSAYSEWMEFLRIHQTPSRRIISHIRHATVGPRALKNTQPFSRELGGQRHVFCHNGDLQCIFQEIQTTRFKPIGDTDSELAFCYLLEQLQTLWNRGEPTLESRIEVIEKVFNKFSEWGPANFLYSDADYLYAYANKRTQANGEIKPPGIYYLKRHCGIGSNTNKFPSVELNNKIDIKGSQQRLVLFASVPLSDENWIPFKPNQLIVSKNGVIL